MTDAPIVGTILPDSAGSHIPVIEIEILARPNGSRAPRVVRYRAPGTPKGELAPSWYHAPHADAGVLGTREIVDAYLKRQEARCDS